jgi:hypothetical protein
MGIEIYRCFERTKTSAFPGNINHVAKAFLIPIFKILIGAYSRFALNLSDIKTIYIAGNMDSLNSPFIKRVGV